MMQKNISLLPASLPSLASLPCLASLLGAAGLLTSVSAQGVGLQVTPAAQAGSLVQVELSGPAGRPFATIADRSGGPARLAGIDFLLGLTPALVVVDQGQIPVGGRRVLSARVPSGASSGTIYWQSVVLDASQPAGVRLTDGESVTIYAGRAAMVEDFSNPAQQGYVGDFDRGVRGRLAGLGIQRRTQTIAQGLGVPFTHPVIGPFSPHGARYQTVYRADQLGATGDPEVVTAIRWLPKGQLIDESWRKFELDVAHTRVAPDFRIDPMTAFPIAPNSGLSRTLANNPRPGSVRVVSGRYDVRRARQRSDGYLDFHLHRTFHYNGVESLLLDFGVHADLSAGNNGLAGFVMVQSSPRPDARVFTAGQLGRPVDPRNVVAAAQGDNFLAQMQFVLERREYLAESPWRRAPVAQPDYQDAIVAASLPTGSRVQLRFRGADSASGAGATAWTSDINRADGKAFLRYRVSLISSAAGAPSVDSIVIPIR